VALPCYITFGFDLSGGLFCSHFALAEFRPQGFPGAERLRITGKERIVLAYCRSSVCKRGNQVSGWLTVLSLSFLICAFLSWLLHVFVLLFKDDYVIILLTYLLIAISILLD